MKRCKIGIKVSLLLVFATISFLSSHSQALAITIDGQLNDWGVNPAAFGSTDWVPYAGISYVVEDTDPAIDFVDPGWGGQAYDAEALYFKKEGLLANFALVTGFPLQGVNYDTFGDFAFDFDSNGSYEFGLETLGNNGFERKYLYGDATFSPPADHTESGPFDLLTGDKIGKVKLVYNMISYVANDHYVMEFSVPISFFGSFWDDPNGTPEFTLHWTMRCGNDAINLYVPGTGTPTVPEPGTLALLGLGLAGLRLSRLKKKLSKRN